VKKTYLVLGAAGSIGKAVARRLCGDGHHVFASVRNGQRRAMGELADMGAKVEVIDDVSDPAALSKLGGAYALTEPVYFDGIVYAVGHCPPGGFPEAIQHPLAKLPLEDYLREINMHQVGALNTFQWMWSLVAPGGCFVFISSAVTRLKGAFPPFLQAHYHASVISALDWLIEGMRHDPVMAGMGIKIHRLAPIAVNTPFHTGGPRPPKLLEVEDVVREVLAALASEETVDKEIA